jgi:aspartate carbamoyltransferase catalytic subunit
MVKHFLSLANLSVSEIDSLLDRSHFFSQNSDHDSLLKNKVIALVFYEPSTRTRCSFEMAAYKLGARIINFSPENTSVKKGETVYDTLKTLESIGVDAIVLRHSDDNICDELQNKLKIPLINAGAGKQEHPSQGLLDLLTLRNEFGHLQGLNVGLCGDIKHSRVAGSMMVAASKYEMNLLLSGPDQLLPSAGTLFDEALETVDAMIMLRIQLERHQSLEINAQIYREKYGMSLARAARMKEKAIIMHPGPFNRGVEIDDDIVEHSRSRIFNQVQNGVYTRMAILENIVRSQ